MDFTGLANAIMQLIFIITGIVSIKSLTEMITQLVGQGDALKDGTDTGKDVKKVAGQATGAAIHGAQLAKAGMKSTQATAEWAKNKIGNSGLANWTKDKWGNMRDKRALHNQERRSADAAIHDGSALQARQDWYQKQAAIRRNKESNARKRLSLEEARKYADEAKKFEDKAKDTDAIKKELKGEMSKRGRIYYGTKDNTWDSKTGRRARMAAGDAADKLRESPVGAFGRTAISTGRWVANKGHVAKAKIDNVDWGNVNAQIKSGGKAGAEAVKNSAFYQEVKNTNKFVFNITGAKGSVKDFLDNADVLDAIEKKGIIKEALSFTGAKSDAAKATKAAQSQAEETAKAMKVQTDAINKTMEDILQALKNIKS